MKKLTALLLFVLTVISVCAFPISCVYADVIEAPTDVPKIIITTDSTINRDTYVTSTIKIIDEKGGQHETIVADDAKIKIRGNSTSSADKKPYNIKFSSKVDVLGMGKNKKWSILANCYDKTLLRNMTVFDFANKAGVPFTSDYRVVDVYVNGSFDGSYMIVDSVEVGETRVDIDTDNNEFLLELDKNPEDEDAQYFYSSRYNIKFAINEPEKEDLTSEQLTYVTNLITNAENALSSGSFDRISQYFDIESMVNFYITLEFFKNVDVNTSSTRFHVKDGKIYGGPVWDFDLSSGNCNDTYYYDYNKYTDNVIEENISYEDLWAVNVPWFGRLMNNSTFKGLVCDRYLELQDDIINLYADNLNGQNKIDYYLDEYAGTIERNNTDAGWRVDKVHHSSMQLERDPDATYEEHIAFYRHWLKKRNEWLLDKWGLDSFVTQTNDNYSTLDGFFIKNIKLGTTAAQILSDFKGASLKLNGEALTGSDLACTGSSITVGGASYALVVKGDARGNGKVDKLDYIVVKRHCLKTITLDQPGLLAGDVDGNGKVDKIDYILIKRHCLGTYTIK